MIFIEGGINIEKEQALFTRGKDNISLKYFEIFSDRKEAMRRELEIKSFSREKKMELIKNFKNS